MVKVPEYTPNVSLRPAFQSQWTVRANAEHFGAAVGRGLQQAAQGMGQLAKSLQAVKALEDEARVREARNQYMQERDVLMYDPENGYMNTQGRNALDQRSAFVENMRKIREKYAKSLTPEQQRLFDRSVETLELDARRSAMIHNGNELKKYVIDGSKAAAENFEQEALRHVGNPDMQDKYLAAGLNELRELGRKQGLDAERQEILEREYVSKARYNSVMMIAAHDPMAADAYFQKYKDQLTAEQQHELRLKLKPLMDDAKAGELFSQWESGAEAARNSDSVVTYGEGEAPDTAPDTAPSEGETPKRTGAVKYINQGAIRKQPITETLSKRLTDAVVSVYGPGYRAEVYSGGQPAPGQGRRVGSTRHDHGRAADVYIVGPDGKRVSGDALAPLAQYWLARGYGGVGIEMRNGGIHLDEHTDRAKTWNYIKQGGRFTAAQRAAVEAGLRGELPDLLSDSGGIVTAGEGGRARGAGDLIGFLNSIQDPAVREATWKRIKAANELRSAQAKAELELLKTEAFSAIDQGVSPDQLPVDVRTKLGRTEMDGLWSYYEKQAGGGRIVTDEAVLSELRRLYAENPEAFAQEDLWKYKPYLSKEDWRTVDGWKQTALTDKRKAAEEGVNLTSAWSQARSQLEAVGITTTGKKGREQEEAARRIALFENTLAIEMEAFKRDNGRAPNQFEIQELINKLLLPIIIRQEKSAWDITKTPWSAFSETDSFLFEAGQIGDLDGGGTAEFNIKYEDIPTGYRLQIERIIREEGGIPSEDEVVRRYVLFLQDAYGIQEDGGTTPGQIAP